MSNTGETVKIKPESRIPSLSSARVSLADPMRSFSDSRSWSYKQAGNGHRIGVRAPE